MRIPRLWRYSLRGLLLFIAVCGVLLAIWTHHARTQRRARQAVEDAGAWVRFTYEYDADGQSAKGAKPPGPAWIRELIGDEYFTSICDVSAQWSRLTDSHLAAFAALPKLRSFTTNHEHVGTLVGTFAIGPGEARGKGHYVDGSYERFTDDQLVTDEGLTHLARCRSLEHLVLFSTDISDAGIASLAGLPNLRLLMIDSPRISDGAVKHFAGMRSLRKLYVHATSITAAGMARLESALPNCEVIY